MSVTTVAVMVLILGFVWGGFALILTLAFRKEREKLRPEGGRPDAG